MATESQPFWKTKSLSEMSTEEWESLCDGCGRCCLNKLEDIDTGTIHYTNVACRLLDLKRCRCSQYTQRLDFVPDCISLSPKNIQTITWLPHTCAYRRLAEGKDLAWWHPLVSHSDKTVHQAGISVRGKVVSEDAIPAQEFKERIIDWIEND